MNRQEVKQVIEAKGGVTISQGKPRELNTKSLASGNTKASESASLANGAALTAGTKVLVHSGASREAPEFGKFMENMFAQEAIIAKAMAGKSNG